MIIDRFDYRIDYKYGNKAYSKAGLLKDSNDLENLKIVSGIRAIEKGFILELALVSKESIELDKFNIGFDYHFNLTDKIFCNGYQSWTESREYSVMDKIPALNPVTAPYKLEYYGDSYFYKYPNSEGRFHSHSYSYVKSEDSDELLFIGSLDETESFSIIEYDTYTGIIRIVKECLKLDFSGKLELLKIIFIKDNEEDSFNRFFKERGAPSAAYKKVSGWTSWYNYYTSIDEKIILSNLSALSSSKIPIDYFQIDDGYQKTIGDWLEVKNTFPSGMKYLSDKIHKAGYKAGLWLAPFVCEKKSSIYKNHKDWLVRNEKGKAVCAGFNDRWKGYFYSLDIYNKEAVEYLREVFNTVTRKWNFDLLKLDFLYAAAVYPYGKSVGRVMHDAVKLIESLKNNRKILGCGGPLEPLFNKADYYRISSDVTLYWEKPLLKKVHYKERNSTFNNLVSNIGRYQLNKRAFLNDPDVFALRDENNKLTTNEKYTLLIVNYVLGGAVFFSDNIANYSKDIMELFRSIYPLVDCKVNKILDTDNVYNIFFSAAHDDYVLYVNLCDVKCEFYLDDGYYFKGKSFIGDGALMEGGRSMFLGPHESILFLTIKERSYNAGSSNHILPGQGFSIQKKNPNELLLLKDNNSPDVFDVYIKLKDRKKIVINGRKYKAESFFPGLDIVKYSFKKQ